MARSIGKLTALKVEKAKEAGMYGDGGGLFLQVSESGAKSWVFRFKEHGRLEHVGQHVGAVIILSKWPPNASKQRMGLIEARQSPRSLAVPMSTAGHRRQVEGWPAGPARLGMTAAIRLPDRIQPGYSPSRSSATKANAMASAGNE